VLCHNAHGVDFFRHHCLDKHAVTCCFMRAHAVPCRAMVAGADEECGSKKEQIARDLLCAVSRFLNFHRCLCNGLPQESVDDTNGQHNGERGASQRAGRFY